MSNAHSTINPMNTHAFMDTNSPSCIPVCVHEKSFYLDKSSGHYDGLLDYSSVAFIVKRLLNL